ncbi:hypothetical protein OC842_005894 [Tilletia horrida]|uniref:Major facilitator superfamily (MFS) profile domain-containing protein n=1 Tax=Tilletia horrida TaxID=155126 RepID=A0AAN6G6X1_9BASI|nr:hypothetical protein OC842_005894 [Tilletia horrida]
MVNERTPLLSQRNGSPPTAQPGSSSSTSPTNGSEHRRHHQDQIPDQVTEMPPLSYLAPILASLWVPVFVVSLDSTIVATLLSSISSSFGHSEQAAWLGTAYLLSIAASSPVYARLCDIIGRKTSILIALTFFTFGTLLCGLAGSMNALLVARAIAGFGGGGMPTVVSVVMSDLVPLKNRGLLQGVTNVVFGLAAGLGGPLGGWMNDTTGWRVAFLVQIPLLGVAYLCIIRFVPSAPRKSADELTRSTIAGAAEGSGPEDPAQRRPRGFLARTRKVIRFLVDMDIPGNAFLIGSIVTILTAVSLMSSNDLPASEPRVVGLLVAGAVCVAVFVVLEWRCGRREAVGAKPVLPLRLLTNRTGAGVAGSNFFLAMFAFSMLYHFPLIFQAVLLQSASVAGLHLIPNSLALSIGSVFAGWYMRKTGRLYWFNLANAVIMTVASVLVANLDAESADWWTYVAIVPSGFGVAAVLTCTLIAAINGVERKDIAVMTGLTYLFRSNGQVLGVAFSGVLLQAILKTQLRQRITGPDAEQIIAQIRHQASIVPTLEPELQRAAVEAYRIALRGVFLCMTVMGVLVVGFCALVRDEELPDFEVAGKKKAGRGEGVEEEEGRAEEAEEEEEEYEGDRH